jgi:hypothetical protein
MTDKDWKRIALGLTQWFPAGDKWAASDGPEAYRLFLETVHELDAADVFKAVVALAREQKFRPSPGEILERIHGKPGVRFAGPEEVWPLIEQAIRRIPGGTSDSRFSERHQAAIDWLRGQDECVAAFAAQRGLRGRGSLGSEEVHHPQYGGAVLKRIVGDYEAIRVRAVERVQLGQAAFPERAFLARGSGDGGGGIAEILERCRPARAIGPGEDSDERVAA